METSSSHSAGKQVPLLASLPLLRSRVSDIVLLTVNSLVPPVLQVMLKVTCLTWGVSKVKPVTAVSWLLPSSAVQPLRPMSSVVRVAPREPLVRFSTVTSATTSKELPVRSSSGKVRV